MLPAVLNELKEGRPLLRTRIGKRFGIAIIAAAWLFWGCAAQQPVEQPQAIPPKINAVVEEPDTTSGWWSVRFFMDRPEDAEPSWYLGPLVAHKIVAPVLDSYRDDIRLWRFHRRAGDDASGHRFTFYFYTTPGIAGQIIGSIRYNDLLNRLTAAGDILKTEYSDPQVNEDPRVEDTSDAKWTPALQKAWPYFIMGASQMWLDLIDKTVAQRSFDADKATLTQILALYREVDVQVISVWQNEGRHAFLHHLNAIFEYKPLWVYERRPLKFYER